MKWKTWNVGSIVFDSQVPPFLHVLDPDLVFYWSLVGKTLLDQRPKPHDCKMKTADFGGFRGQNLLFLSKSAVFTKIRGFYQNERPLA